MSLRTTLLATIGAVALAATGAHAATYSLAGSLGATPNFSITSGGATATFTSPAGNGFMVQDASGLLSFSPALLDSNFFGTDNLTISFSQPVSSQITIPFAILHAFNASSDTLTATTNSGQSITFGTSSNGLPLAEPEGVVSFVPSAAFTSVTLSSPIAFAIGNVNVPEPMSIALLGTGLVGFAATRRKHRAA